MQDPFNLFLWTIKPKQADILIRLYYTEQSIYLVDLIQTPLNSEIQIKILGNRNKYGDRESYFISFNKIVGEFKCDCKDYVYRCEKENLLCKHISHLVCKVFCLFDAHFFNTLSLNTSQIQFVMDCLGSTYLWKNRYFSIKDVNEEFNQSAKQFDKDEKCPICYDNLEVREHTVSCHDCHNYVHTKCMKVWLEQCYTCVFCRSGCWYNFNSEFA
jgi:hypothetical protein